MYRQFDDYLMAKKRFDSSIRRFDSNANDRFAGPYTNKVTVYATKCRDGGQSHELQCSDLASTITSRAVSISLSFRSQTVKYQRQAQYCNCRQLYTYRINHHGRASRCLRELCHLCWMLSDSLSTLYMYLHSSSMQLL